MLTGGASTASVVAHRASAEGHAADGRAAERHAADRQSTHGGECANGHSAKREEADRRAAQRDDAAREAAQRDHPRGDIAHCDEALGVAANLTALRIPSHCDVIEGKTEQFPGCALANSAHCATTRLPGYLSLQLRHSFLELLPALHGILRLERGNNSIGPRIVPMAFTPPRIIPPTRPLGRFGFLATFVRNPLEVVPQAAYEEDFVPVEGTGSRGAWVTAPAIIKAVLL